MSKRAEEAALKAYPDKVFRYKKIGDADGVMTGESVDSQQYIRDYFIEGYEQAEKDLALSWEDIAKIDAIILDVNNEFAVDYSKEISRQKFYEEVLRRFNERRKK